MQLQPQARLVVGYRVGLVAGEGLAGFDDLPVVEQCPDQAPGQGDVIADFQTAGCVGSGFAEVSLASLTGGVPVAQAHSYVVGEEASETTLRTSSSARAKFSVLPCRSISFKARSGACHRVICRSHSSTAWAAPWCSSIRRTSSMAASAEASDSSRSLASPVSRSPVLNRQMARKIS